MTRTEHIRRTLKLSQREMAELLRVSQPTITNLESGRSTESGPISIVLDMLAEKHGIHFPDDAPPEATPLEEAS